MSGSTIFRSPGIKTDFIQLDHLQSYFWEYIYPLIALLTVFRGQYLLYTIAYLTFPKMCFRFISFRCLTFLIKLFVILEIEYIIGRILALLSCVMLLFCWVLIYTIHMIKKLYDVTVLSNTRKLLDIYYHYEEINTSSWLLSFLEGYTLRINRSGKQKLESYVPTVLVLNFTQRNYAIIQLKSLHKKLVSCLWQTRILNNQPIHLIKQTTPIIVLLSALDMFMFNSQMWFVSIRYLQWK